MTTLLTDFSNTAIALYWVFLLGYILKGGFIPATLNDYDKGGDH